jgi:hypothetical protein
MYSTRSHPFTIHYEIYTVPEIPMDGGYYNLGGCNLPKCHQLTMTYVGFTFQKLIFQFSLFLS